MFVKNRPWTRLRLLERKIYLINMHDIDSTCLSEVVKRSIKLPYLYLVRWSI